MLLRLRLWAVYYLNELADTARQAISVGEPLAADSEPVLADQPRQPDLAEQPRQRPQGGGRAGLNRVLRGALCFR
jgi:hypothetical protein